MSPQSRLLRSSAVAAAATAALVPAAPSGAAEAPSTPEVRVEGATARHCTTTALPIEELRAGARNEVHCYDTFAGAMDAAGVDVPAGATLDEQRTAALASGSVLAIHYDGFNATGSTLTVNGSTCSGYGVSLAGHSFDDVASSTRHQLCTQIKHWTGSDYTGTVQLTEGSWGAVRNLNGSLSNAASSMGYW